MWVAGNFSDGKSQLTLPLNTSHPKIDPHCTVPCFFFFSLHLLYYYTASQLHVHLAFQLPLARRFLTVSTLKMRVEMLMFYAGFVTELSEVC